jgi:hypothetical protein
MSCVKTGTCAVLFARSWGFLGDAEDAGVVERDLVDDVPQTPRELWKGVFQGGSIGTYRLLPFLDRWLIAKVLKPHEELVGEVIHDVFRLYRGTSC